MRQGKRCAGARQVVALAAAVASASVVSSAAAQVFTWNTTISNTPWSFNLAWTTGPPPFNGASTIEILFPNQTTALPYVSNNDHASAAFTLNKMSMLDPSIGLTGKPLAFTNNGTANPRLLTSSNQEVTNNVSYAAPLEISNTANTKLTMSGVITGSSPITKDDFGTLRLTGANTWSGPTIVQQGTVELSKSNEKSSSWTLNSGALVKLDPTPVGTIGIKTGPISITGNSLIDVTRDKLITTSLPGIATAAIDPITGENIYTGVQRLVQTAQNGSGEWDGTNGITTSEFNAKISNLLGGAPLTTVGVATGAQIRGLSPTDTDFFCTHTISGADTICMYTYAGDANLDGVVNGDDFALIDFNVNIPQSDGYYNGDFNYDGRIDPSDYAYITWNFYSQGPPLCASPPGLADGVAAVPEPAGLAALILAGALARDRRRRVASR